MDRLSHPSRSENDQALYIVDDWLLMSNVNVHDDMASILSFRTFVSALGNIGIFVGLHSDPCQVLWAGEDPISLAAISPDCSISTSIFMTGQFPTKLGPAILSTLQYVGEVVAVHRHGLMTGIICMTVATFGLTKSGQ
ncbi:hypothetical protein BDW42DRAFT_23092 [Aspergillus taichungensis]|uniref:Uncharacterized protein n=1 Tax=Aspergillus taichungensis TaxID=482145 RepID=A0A2J5HH59_9EURO|nr:hypothetical protein BDW42DRAFT_23092 [Aspergillus taichungensis]